MKDYDSRCMFITNPKKKKKKIYNIAHRYTYPFSQNRFLLISPSLPPKMKGMDLWGERKVSRWEDPIEI